MLLVNPIIAFNAVGESHNEGTFHGSFVCPMNTKFNHENGCVREYIFFLFWPYNHFFEKSRYLSTLPFKLTLSYYINLIGVISLFICYGPLPTTRDAVSDTIVAGGQARIRLNIEVN